jgi:REP element-mobilizing transposase RayT
MRVDGRGGRRKNAGRKPKGPRAGSSHKMRANFSPRSPLHVVLRADHTLGNLRDDNVYEAVRCATSTVAKWAGNVRIVHMSIQSSHLHLLVEATHRFALSSGMQAFQISAAKRINRAVSIGQPRRRGRVFTDRYHAEVLVTPTQVHHAINYILNNWRHHGEHTRLEASAWTLDRFSSAVLFRDWREGSWQIPVGYKPLVMQQPQTWLASVGYRRGGAPISCFAVPGNHRNGPPQIIEVDLVEYPA